MAIVPKPIGERIQFYKTHLVAFTEHADAIGTSPEAVALSQAKADAAFDAHRAQRMAMDEARSATLRLKIAMREMSRQGAAVIAQVRSKAESTDDPGIYPLSSLPAPAAESPMPGPGTPTNLKIAFHGAGQILLTWDCKNPRGSEGTMYEIRRGSENLSDMQFLRTVGKKRFIDETIPAGATALLYSIRAIRSTKRGAEAFFPVSFGTNGRQPLPQVQMKNAA